MNRLGGMDAAAGGAGEEGGRGFHCWVKEGSCHTQQFRDRGLGGLRQASLGPADLLGGPLFAKRADTEIR